MLHWNIVIIGILLTISSSTFGQYQFDYDLSKPKKTIELPSFLNEVSGVSLCETQEVIWAVQDERGVIFKLDIENGAVIDSLPFWKKGDYEGIEIVGDNMYVLKSSGTIYKVQLTGKDSLSIEKFNHHLEKEDDAEGLGYDQKKQQLLIACKNGKNGERKIYPFDIQLDSLFEEPRFIISKKEAMAYLSAHPELKKWKKLHKKFKDKLEFAPSGVAVHPKTQDIYVLSSQGKTLVVLHADGQIAHMEKLEKEIHPQPEGICFDQEGNLFISNEGKEKDGVGKIYKFERKIERETMKGGRK